MEDRLAELYCWPRRYTLPQMRHALKAEFPAKISVDETANTSLDETANISLDETYRKIQELKMNDRVRYDELYNMWWVTGNDGGNAWA